MASPFISFLQCRESGSGALASFRRPPKDICCADFNTSATCEKRPQHKVKPRLLTHFLKGQWDASRSLATAQWKARVASGLLRGKRTESVRLNPRRPGAFMMRQQTGVREHFSLRQYGSSS